MKEMKKIFFAVILLATLVSCKKNTPIDDMGKSNGNFRPELRVNLSTKVLKVGDTVVITSTTWQKNDKIAKVEYLHKLYEDFGINLELQTTKLETWNEVSPRMVVTDTIANDAWLTFPGEGKKLDDYYVTNSNAYVLAGVYKKFVATGGKYKMEGADLLRALPEEPYRILVNQLSFVITVQEYSTFFPVAPDSHFIKTGTVKTGISEEGKSYLRAELTKDLLIAKGFKSVKKQGALHATVTVRVTAQSGAIAQSINQFEATY